MVAPPEGDGPKLSPSLVQVLGPLPTDWHRKPGEKRFPVKVEASTDRRTDGQTDGRTDKVATIGSFSQKENSLKTLQNLPFFLRKKIIYFVDTILNILVYYCFK